jgi:hypothetical protein
VEGTLRGRRPAHHTGPPRCCPSARVPGLDRGARPPGHHLIACNAC